MEGLADEYKLTVCLELTSPKGSVVRVSERASESQGSVKSMKYTNTDSRTDYRSDQMKEALFGGLGRRVQVDCLSGVYLPEKERSSLKRTSV